MTKGVFEEEDDNDRKMCAICYNSCFNNTVVPPTHTTTCVCVCMSISFLYRKPL